jgi:hypothetical protein
MKIYTSRECNERFNASPITFKNVKDEVKELVEFENWENFKEELSDVIYMVLCMIHGKTGVSLPMFGAGRTIMKILFRHIIWKKIFKDNGLVFDKKYLINGSNYNKIEKVNLALELARKE